MQTAIIASDYVEQIQLLKLIQYLLVSKLNFDSTNPSS